MKNSVSAPRWGIGRARGHRPDRRGGTSDEMRLRVASVLDTAGLVISNVLLIEPVMGVRKTSIGVRRGRICAIGRAGNPDMLDGVEASFASGVATIMGQEFGPVWGVG